VPISEFDQRLCLSAPTLVSNPVLWVMHRVGLGPAGMFVVLFGVGSFEIYLLVIIISVCVGFVTALEL
jgi:hypothetical protein